jgi:hypothetical protein
MGRVLSVGKCSVLGEFLTGGGRGGLEYGRSSMSGFFRFSLLSFSHRNDSKQGF